MSDKTSGKLYVGSAYGSGGLLNRWKNYIETKHGGNKGMISVLRDFPNRFENFQFTILQVLPKTLTAEEVIGIENLYKRKLLSINFGMNEN
ncbi:GIY-YIG nuclease family protein [Paenibacillus sp. OV219]|uniref:GIY-YIG nuclease family protein n=1 Tax=Paenibacillus sp. OV219 TaxID=1884377 RepID=UPI0035288739